MTKTELRLEALKLAVATQGNSNKVICAGEYLTFLTEDFAADNPVSPFASEQLTAAATTGTTVPERKEKRK